MKQKIRGEGKVQTEYCAKWCIYILVTYKAHLLMMNMAKGDTVYSPGCLRRGDQLQWRS